MTSLRGVWVSSRIKTKSSIVHSVVTSNRKISICNPFQEAAMKLDRLLEQNDDSSDFYCSLKAICCSKSIQNIGARSLPLQILYDYCKNSGLDHDRVYITGHINSTGIIAIKSWNFNLIREQLIYTQAYQIVITLHHDLYMNVILVQYVNGHLFQLDKMVEQTQLIQKYLREKYKQKLLIPSNMIV